MRIKFEEQLKQLHDSLIEMGKMVEHAIASADKALLEQNVELAKTIIAFDDEIDAKEKEIEDLCMQIILRHQPVAGDLRLVSAVLKMITDLERIGDHASDISEITMFLADKPYIKKLEHLTQMASAAMKMVSESIKAVVTNDLNLAQQVIASDDIMDDLFITVKNEIIELIKQKTENSDQAIDFLMIAKYFERIGDHAENIAEWVVYTHTGKHKGA